MKINELTNLVKPSDKNIICLDPVFCSNIPEYRISGVEKGNDQSRIGSLQALIETDDLKHSRYRDQNEGHDWCEVSKLERMQFRR